MLPQRLSSSVPASGNFDHDKDFRRNFWLRGPDFIGRTSARLSEASGM